MTVGFSGAITPPNPGKYCLYCPCYVIKTKPPQSIQWPPLMLQLTDTELLIEQAISFSPMNTYGDPNLCQALG